MGAPEFKTVFLHGFSQLPDGYGAVGNFAVSVKQTVLAAFFTGASGIPAPNAESFKARSQLTKVELHQFIGADVVRIVVSRIFFTIHLHRPAGAFPAARPAAFIEVVHQRRLLVERLGDFTFHEIVMPRKVHGRIKGAVLHQHIGDAFHIHSVPRKRMKNGQFTAATIGRIGIKTIELCGRFADSAKIVLHLEPVNVFDVIVFSARNISPVFRHILPVIEYPLFVQEKPRVVLIPSLVQIFYGVVTLFEPFQKQGFPFGTEFHPTPTDFGVVGHTRDPHKFFVGTVLDVFFGILNSFFGHFFLVIHHLGVL